MAHRYRFVSFDIVGGISSQIHAAFPDVEVRCARYYFDHNMFIISNFVSILTSNICVHWIIAKDLPFYRTVFQLKIPPFSYYSKLQARNTQSVPRLAHPTIHSRLARHSRTTSLRLPTTPSYKPGILNNCP